MVILAERYSMTANCTVLHGQNSAHYAQMPIRLFGTNVSGQSGKDVHMKMRKTIVEIDKIKRTAIALTAVVLLCGGLSGRVLPLTARASEPLGWYCTRARDHAQPRADACFDFVERHGGYYIDHRHKDPTDPDRVVYLTFDVGYENGNVARVLDALKAAGVPGAFFILGHVVEAEPALVRRMADEGHLICNHTYTHKTFTGQAVSGLEGELHRLEAAAAGMGVTMAPYFRPPEGKLDLGMLKAAERLGYRTILWSFAYADWDNAKQPDPAAAKKKILDNLHNGAVILLHPTSATNAAILGEVIEAIRAEGYRFGTLYELTADRASQPPETAPETGHREGA